MTQAYGTDHVSSLSLAAAALLSLASGNFLEFSVIVSDERYYKVIIRVSRTFIVVQRLL